MTDSKPRFYDSGVTVERRTKVGNVQLNPAKRFAKISLSRLQREYGFRFVLPHLLYDQQLVVDPVEEYARQSGKTIPAVFWDAEYTLIYDLSRPEIQAKANRIYAVLEEDMREVMNVSHATLFFHPETKKASRIQHQICKLYDFNAPKIGQLNEADVSIDVVVWTVKYFTHECCLLPHKHIGTVPSAYKTHHKYESQPEGSTAQVNLNNFYETIEKDPNVLEKEIQSTEIETDQQEEKQS